MKLNYTTTIYLLVVILITSEAYTPKENEDNPIISSNERIDSRQVFKPSRATTYSSLLTLNVSNAIVVALVAAAGAFYYGGIPFVSIRRSVSSIWDSMGVYNVFEYGLADLWDSGLSDAVTALTPVVQEALRVYSESYS